MSSRHTGPRARDSTRSRRDARRRHCVCRTPFGPTAAAYRWVADHRYGTATIQDVGGRRVLRLTEFATSNGPDVRVYLVAATDAADNETVTKAGFVELGKLKGNLGDQNYDLPDDLDLTQYRAVTIWCRRFSVNFATAPLTPAS